MSSSDRFVYSKSLAPQGFASEQALPVGQTEALPMRIIRLNDVIHISGLARSTIYKSVGEGSFPRPISLGARAIGWIEAEVIDWIKERVRARDMQAHRSE